LTDESPGTPGTYDEKCWRATLELACEKRGLKTCLTRNRHCGPLVVQKPLYPEGEGLCHAVLLHPPGGIAGGDRLAVGITLGEECEALVTTPGATKFYRSSGNPALQAVSLELAAGAKFEWLPQETIVFNGALARQDFAVALGDRSVYLGQDIVCLGRRASGETFSEGYYSQRASISRNGKMIWRDCFDFDGKSGVLETPAGLCGKHVYGTMTVADERASAQWLKAVREVLSDAAGQTAATLLPGVLVIRRIGDSTERVRQVFLRAWEVLRPLAFGRPARIPRLWNT